MSQDNIGQEIEEDSRISTQKEEQSFEDSKTSNNINTIKKPQNEKQLNQAQHQTEGEINDDTIKGDGVESTSSRQGKESEVMSISSRPNENENALDGLRTVDLGDEKDTESESSDLQDEPKQELKKQNGDDLERTLKSEHRDVEENSTQIRNNNEIIIKKEKDEEEDNKNKICKKPVVQTSSINTSYCSHSYNEKTQMKNNKVLRSKRKKSRDKVEIKKQSKSKKAKKPKMKFSNPSYHHMDHESKTFFRKIRTSRSRSPISRNSSHLDQAILKDRDYYQAKQKESLSPNPRKLRNVASKTQLVNGEKVVPLAENVHHQIVGQL